MATDREFDRPTGLAGGLPAGPPAGPPGDGAEGSRVVLDVLPLGFFLGGVAAVARALLVVSATPARLGDDARALRVVAQAERWPELLGEGMVAAVVSVLALDAAARTRRGPLTALAVTVTFLALGAFLSDFPANDPGLGAPVVLAALGLTLLGLGIGRLGVRGPLALGLGVLVGIGLPLGLARTVASRHEGMPVRVVLLDLVAAPELLSTYRSRNTAPPEPGVLTPAVDQRTDTGDKPSLVLPPPATQEFTVPRFPEGTRLVAAAGADQSVVERLPADMEELRVVYRIRVDGEVAWEQTIAHRRMPPGTFDTTSMQWQHVEVDGARGLPVRAGQLVRFETDLVPGQQVEGLTDEGLRLGFGGASLVRTYRERRRVARREAPNVVYVVMDTLRRDRLGCYGYDRPTSPRLDAFAAQGLQFMDAYTTSSWTWPSTASLMTGLLPDSHGVKSSKACTLSQRLETLAEALQARGYTTAAFSGNPIVEPDRFFDQGFESFDVEVPEFRMSDVVVPPALEWLEVHAPVRFFLYLHLVDPHAPHDPHPDEMVRLGLPLQPPDWPEAGFRGILRRDTPSEAVKTYASQLYDTSVATGDRWFGAVLDKLQELGLTESTIVVFTSDHGEEVFDHGFRGHGHDVWAELVRAPLVIAGPGIPRGVRSGAVSNRFVPTTLASLVGADLEIPGPRVHLVDDRMPDEALFETTKGIWGKRTYQQIYGIRRGVDVTHWRASELELEDLPDSDVRRFDVISDPVDGEDLARVAPDSVREHVKRIRAIVEEAEESRPPLVLGVGAQGQDQLRGMGYTDDDDGK
ncbi:MAG: sulfatase-like hydrolase/transferase [Planctomycetota bacterium]